VVEETDVAKLIVHPLAQMILRVTR